MTQEELEAKILQFDKELSGQMTEIVGLQRDISKLEKEMQEHLTEHRSDMVNLWHLSLTLYQHLDPLSPISEETRQKYISLLKGLESRLGITEDM